VLIVTAGDADEARDAVSLLAPSVRELWQGDLRSGSSVRGLSLTTPAGEVTRQRPGHRRVRSAAAG